MISNFAGSSVPRRRFLALALLPLAIGASGCGSATEVHDTAKEKAESERYRLEGKGKAQQKVLIRRKDERLKERPDAPH